MIVFDDGTEFELVNYKKDYVNEMEKLRVRTVDGNYEDIKSKIDELSEESVIELYNDGELEETIDMSIWSFDRLEEILYDDGRKNVRFSFIKE